MVLLCILYVHIQIINSNFPDFYTHHDKLYIIKLHVINNIYINTSV